MISLIIFGIIIILFVYYLIVIITIFQRSEFFEKNNNFIKSFIPFKMFFLKGYKTKDK
ncbi:MAG TPA: hypothetical protein PLN85_01350 [archaeon]|nr:hypothetical protein [archaeon]